MEQIQQAQSQKTDFIIMFEINTLAFNHIKSVLIIAQALMSYLELILMKLPVLDHILIYISVPIFSLILISIPRQIVN